MGDGGAKRSRLRTVFVKVDPLEVAGSFGKLLDLFRGNGMPFALADLLSDSAFEVVDSINVSSHS